MAEPIVLGIVGIKNMGLYDANTNYEKLNVVTYQGSTYCALQSTKGNLPTDTDYWQLYAEKGGTGDTGPQGPKPVKGVDYYTAADKAEIEADLAESISDAVSESVGSLTSATPLAASSTADMTDTTRIYVNTTDGNWYYYDGDSWEIGGTYQGTVPASESVGVENLKTELKNTKKYRVPSFTANGGSYINASGVLTTLSGYRYSTPIQLYKGETIQIVAGGSGGNVAIFSETDSTASSYSMILRDYGDDVQNTYKYTATKDMYVALSYKNSLYDSVIIYKNDILGEPVIDAYNNLITSNDSFLYSNGKLTYAISSNNDKIYKNKLEVDIDSDGTISYGWNWYLLRKFKLQQTTTIKKISGIIELKSSDISKCLFVFSTLAGGFIGASQISLHGISNIGSDYKRYFFEIDCNLSADGFCLGIANRISGEQTDGTITIRYLGAAINQNVDEFSNNLLTVKDIELINEKEKYVPLFDSFVKFGAIGDSLASGESVAKDGGTSVYVDNFDYSWGQFIARHYGIECINFSKGGATTRSWLTGAFGLAKLQDPNNKCNAYVCGLGVNDANVLGAGYLGTIADINVSDYTQNADTFYGNYGKIISNIKLVQPKAKIFLLTIPDTSSNYTNFNTAIRNIVDLFDDVYLIDLYTNNLEEFTSGFVQNNRRAGHYNSIAYNYISEILFKALSDYMYSNYTEFKQIEFIGTDYEW